MAGPRRGTSDAVVTLTMAVSGLTFYAPGAARSTGFRPWRRRRANPRYCPAGGPRGRATRNHGRMTEARPEQRRMTVSDPQVMRALAHPARIAIMEHLGVVEGGATATECAEVAGLSPSATSYHLRALAKSGLVEQAPSRGDARERLWRTVGRSLMVDAGRSAGPDARAAEEALVEAHAARDMQRTRDWLRRAGDEPAEWYDVALFSDTLLLLTADELAGLNEAVSALFEPYRQRNRQADPPAGARTVAVQYRTVPLA